MLLYVLPIVFLGLGIIQTIYPEKTFMFGRRWMFTEESHLSDMSKFLIRVAGIVIMVISVWMLIKGVQETFCNIP